MQEKRISDVSIISANYNNGRYLASFIESVVASSSWPAELILINDGSTDNSLDVLEMYREFPFLKVINFPQNQGLSRALNAGLDQARGKYIMRADPDDIMLPERITIQVDYLEQHPDIDILGSNVIYFHDDKGTTINHSNFPHDHDSIVKLYMLGEHGLQHPTVCAKAAVFKKFRYTPGLSPTEDYDIFSRMALEGHRFENLPTPLYRMRVHTASSTSNTNINAIRQTFAYRDKLWGTRTSGFKIWCYYHHILHYRRYQLNQTLVNKYTHLLLSAMFLPRKVLNRISG